ncbi:hypothetical protein C8J57DRAFT_1282841 [Mycena rebaudengoi]|nr:hypothetical protein C8J57DRAFT_1282841 [Mycena rebaudengoi]
MPSYSNKSNKGTNGSRPNKFVKIAADTLAAVERGGFDLNGETHAVEDLSKSHSATDHYPPDNSLSRWAADSRPPDAISHQTELVLCQNSTLEGVQYCIPLGRKIGVLNFASATRPGGGFLGGARAQEESIARSSNLYSSLMTPQGQKFYNIHKGSGKSKYYTHSMIYTRGVQLFRSDDGDWVKPCKVDMLTSAAVNAGVVRSRAGGGNGKGDTPATGSGTEDVEEAIKTVMRERMGRILFLFEKEGAQDLVLGSFGTGVFRNNLWAELLAAPDARFKNSFERVVFAIIDEKTCNTVKGTFDSLAVNFTQGSGATVVPPAPESV